MQGIKKQIRDIKYLSWILIISNWLFQGILHADKTEKIYRVFFSLFFWTILFLLIEKYCDVSLVIAITFSFIIAHTFNWIINGNFYNLIIHRLMLVKLSKRNLFFYIKTLQKRIGTQNWVLYAASFGSICKGKLKDSSDLDISIVRKPGFKNAVLSILFAVKEKKYADFKGIPLEIYISDSPIDSVKRFGGENNPVVLYDPEGVIDTYYQARLTIEEARVLNSV